MSNERISNEYVIPEIESQLFIGHETARFAVGIVAVGNTIVPGLENEHNGYTRLRGNVYALQEHYMPVDDLKEDGGEVDMDDARSVHFALIENAVRNQRVVGAMRLIVKSHDNPAMLPIEEHYPEVFQDASAPYRSTEVSRLIGRHEDKRIQAGLKWPLFTAGVTYIMDHQLGPVFGVVKDHLARSLNGVGVPVTRLGEAKFVPEFNAHKLPLRIDVGGLAETLEDNDPNLLDAMQVVENKFVYSGTMPAEAETAPVA